MTLEEIVRQKTLEIKDALSLVERSLGEAVEKKAVAEDRVRRAAGEIKSHREQLQEARRQMTEAETRVEDVRAQLEELDRQRATLSEQLLTAMQSRQELETGLKGEQAAERRLDDERRDAFEATRRLQNELEQQEENRTRHLAALRRAYVQAFSDYLVHLAGGVTEALSEEETRQRRIAEADAFKRRRHQDPEIGDLCDQRDQYLGLLAMATVPRVKEEMQRLLSGVEESLRQLCPGALDLGDVAPIGGFVADLYCLRSSQDRLSIVLPVDAACWRQMRDGVANPTVTASVRLVYALAKGLGLKPGDAEFDLRQGWCVLHAELDEEEASILTATPLPVPGFEALQLRFSRLPSEIEEAILHEAADPPDRS